MANKAISTLAVGSSVYLSVGGVRTEFLVVNQGKPSSMYDNSCDGTWLLMKDCYESLEWHRSNVNTYERSDIHSYLNSTFLNLFDSNIRDAIKQVKLPYRRNGGPTGSNQSGANGLSCKVFLLSGYEVGFTTSDSSDLPVDSAKLSHFESGTSSSALNKRIAYLNGSVAYWWLRSPSIDNAKLVWRVSTNGDYSNNGSPSNSNGVRPAFILPSNLLVDDSGNVIVPDLHDLTAHKAIVNGTAYTVQGGKCMVDGTVYNILKGRTLIGGTGWDIAFPAPRVMPVKGDLITMNLDGTDRVYRVLKIVDKTTVEVLGMWDVRTSIAFSKTYEYRGSLLDDYLNTTWYNTLSTAAKAAIVAKNITQYQYEYVASAHNETTHSSYADYSTKKLVANIGERYVYALDIEDIEMYFGGTGGSTSDKTPATFSKADLLRMLWYQSATSEYQWLRSAVGGQTSALLYGWAARFKTGATTRYGLTNKTAARPAFQIDLSQIDFTIN